MKTTPRPYPVNVFSVSPSASTIKPSHSWLTRSSAARADSQKSVGTSTTVAGTTLFIPVHVPGALLEVGDGHAGQGDGEVDITALETSLTGVLEVIVRKDMKLTWPRGETPTHWITMGADKDLVVATKTALRQAIEFLQTKGAVDFICDRRELRRTVANTLAMLQRQPADAVS